jgi:hypothetical protein
MVHPTLSSHTSDHPPESGLGFRLQSDIEYRFTATDKAMKLLNPLYALQSGEPLAKE